MPTPPDAIATLRTALDKAICVDDNPAYLLGQLLNALDRGKWTIVPDAEPLVGRIAEVRWEARYRAAAELDTAVSNWAPGTTSTLYPDAVEREAFEGELKDLVRRLSAPTNSPEV